MRADLSYTAIGVTTCGQPVIARPLAVAAIYDFQLQERQKMVDRHGLSVLAMTGRMQAQRTTDIPLNISRN